MDKTGMITMTPVCEVCGEKHPRGDIIFRTDQAYRCWCEKHTKYAESTGSIDNSGWILELIC